MFPVKDKNVRRLLWLSNVICLGLMVIILAALGGAFLFRLRPSIAIVRWKLQFRVLRQGICMIKNKTAAKEISVLMLEIQSELDESIRMVREACDEADFKIYREAVSKVLVEILREVLNPLYSAHPSLKPERMR